MFARMTNLKLGKYFEDETQTISDVEAALNRQNIAIRESEHTFRPMGDVIGDVAAKWKELNDTDRESISIAVAGIRQRETFIALMNNYGETLRAIGVELDSAGLATERYSIYLGSVEAAQNNFTSSWELLSSSIWNSDVIKYFYNLTSAIMESIATGEDLSIVLDRVMKSFKINEAVKSTEYIINEITAGNTGLYNDPDMLLMQMKEKLKYLKSGMNAERAELESQLYIVNYMLANGKTPNDIYNGVKLGQLEANTKSKLSNKYAEFGISDDERKDIETTKKIIDDYALNIAEANIKLSKAETTSEEKKDIQSRIDGWTNSKKVLEDYLKSLDTLTAYESETKKGDVKPATSRNPEQTKYARDIYEGAVKDGKTELQETALDLLNNMRYKNRETEDGGIFKSDKLKEQLDLVSDIQKALNLRGPLDLTTEGIANFKNELEQVDSIANYLKAQINAGGGFIADPKEIKDTTDAESLQFNKWQNDIKVIVAENAVLIASNAVVEQSVQNVNDKLAITKNLSAMTDKKAYDEAVIDLKIAKDDLDTQIRLAKASAKSSGGGGGGSQAYGRNAEAYKQMLSMTIDMLKKEKEQEKDNLKNQLDGFKKIIDARKKILDQQKSERDYTRKTQDMNKDISKIQNELLELQYDNSESAKARRLELQEELISKQKDLEDEQYDYSIDKQKQALDDEYDAFKENIESRIQDIEEYLSNTGQIEQEAINLLKSNSGAFYQQLLEWNKQFGTSIQANVINGWIGAEKSYLNYVTTVASHPVSIPTREDSHNYEYDVDALTPSHHSGGFAGGLASNEEFAKLIKGEYISTESDMKNFMSNVLPKTVMSASDGMGGNITIDMPINVAGNLDKTVLPDIKKIVDKSISELVKTMNNRGYIRNVSNYSV